MTLHTLRIAVATDLHYMSAAGTGKVAPAVSILGTGKDPMNELISFVHGLGSNGAPLADILLCPGDITTRADKSAFDVGWGNLKVLRDALGAKKLVAATGNHEVNSRAGDHHRLPGNAEQAVDPFAFLISAEGYPAEFEHTHSKWVYWGRGYEILCGENWLIVIVNSCHYHSSLLDNEFERGRISEAALAELKTDIARLSIDRPFRMMLLHHPPLPHEDVNVELGRIGMYNGCALLQTLEESLNDWIIIHGHKHYHRLIRASGAPYAPVIFGAASFGAQLTGAVSTNTRNQFYVLELQATPDASQELRLRGHVSSYYWTGNEWREAREKVHGLPHGGGFCCQHIDIIRLAQDIKSLLLTSSNPYESWSDVAQAIDTLNYLTPSEVDAIKKKLKAIGVKFIDDERVWFPDQISVDKP